MTRAGTARFQPLSRASTMSHTHLHPTAHRFRWFILPCCRAFSTCTLSRPIRLDDVLKVLEKYGGLDPAIRDSRKMLDCVVKNNGNPGPCFNIATEAEKQAEIGKQHDAR